MPTSFDPAQVIATNDLLSSVAEEMGICLERSAYSPNIKERRDYSCAVFDAEGRLAAQAAHIPVHLGAMAALVRELRGRFDWREGDTVICNDPYVAGTHLPDISLVSPAFHDGVLAGFVASRAHHADVGGVTPGSMPLTPDLFGEGLRIPPMKFGENVAQMICSNSRAPEERRGDLGAQLAANLAGVRGLAVLAARFSVDGLSERMGEAIAYSAALATAALEAIPDGHYEFSDFLDSDGVSPDPVRIKLALTAQGRTLTFDFTGSSTQRTSGVNATLAVTESACLYVVRCLLDADAPTNEGCREGVTIVAPPGTVVNASFPAPVAGGNVETSQRITDVALGALAKALPDRVPAASQGTMNNLSFGGWDLQRGRAFAYYETIGGGGGAGPTRPGTSGIHCHMTNTRNTPIEALEYAMPLRVVEYRSVSGTGGRGLFRGGDAIRRTFLMQVQVTCTLMADRRCGRPYGLEGGTPGASGRDWAVSKGRRSKLEGKGQFSLDADSRLTIRTPGGGGWGAP